MNLYAWQPDGYGALSYFVMAESEQEAKAAVEASKEFMGWSNYRDDYQLTVVKELDVITNDNG